MILVVIFISIICLCFDTVSPIPVLAEDQKFANANTGISFYRTTSCSDTISDTICIVEATYYVEILGDMNNCYKAMYNGLNGYVKKNDVRLVSNTPSTPFPNNIHITLSNNCMLRSSPSTKTSISNVISTISKDNTDIIFLGRIFAEETFDFGGTEWYLVRANNDIGYIYNQYVKSMTPIYPSVEKANYLSSSIPSKPNPLSSASSITIIVLLSLPCIAVIVILYIPSKKHKPVLKNKTKEIDRY